MKRREFIAGFGSAATSPVVARAQSDGMSRLAIITPTAPVAEITEISHVPAIVCCSANSANSAMLKAEI
jgi:hypothetical protein